ncbi:MAG: hypothetical protein K2X47_15425 [Bdellovibrionales bacterium]|nr:hypothetical protein [Bdellovibrionales bacterium]
MLKLFLSLYFCLLGASGIWAWKHKEIVFEKFLLSRPVRKESFWKKYPRLQVQDRVFEAPPELLEQVFFENMFHGIKRKPSLVTLSPDLRLAISKSLQKVPDTVKKEIGPLLIGVFPVANIGSNGITFTILGDSGNLPMGAVVLIDVSVLDLDANAWLSAKERSIFQLQTINVETSIAGPSEFPPEGSYSSLDEFQGLTFLLLHEFGHISALAKNLKQVPETKEYFFPPEAFAKLNWMATVQNGTEVIAARNWSSQNKPPFSFFENQKKKLLESDVDDIFQSLRTSTFATLYATTSPVEDYAESYAVYHHTQSLNRPYETRVTADGQIKRSLESCMRDQRCPALKDYFHEAQPLQQTEVLGH